MPRRRRGAPVIRVAILAPTDFSLFARAVAGWSHAEPGMTVVAVVTRRVLSFARIASELRRDGPRLLAKVWRKAILGGDASTETSLLAHRAGELGAPPDGLAAWCSRNGVPHLT